MDNNIFDPYAWVTTETKNDSLTNGSQVTNNQSSAEEHTRLTHATEAKAELLAVINELLVRGINITESYHDWLRVGFALAEELGAEGREPFHRLSAMSTKYNERECEAKWQSLLRSNSGRVTKGTIFWMAEQAGVNIAAL